MYSGLGISSNLLRAGFDTEAGLWDSLACVPELVAESEDFCVREATRETVVALDLFVMEGRDMDESVVGDEERVEGSEEAFFWDFWVDIVSCIDL